MSQHDYVIADADGATFLADLNAMAAAVATLNSGASAPATTYSYMLWADTTTGTLKMRNAANSAWIIVGTLASVNLGLVAADTSVNLTAGYTATSYSAGTKSSGTFTPDPANCNVQHYTNGGAHTLAPPSSVCSMLIEVTNNASAGAITTSGFTKVSGAAPDTTNGNKFLAVIVKTSSASLLTWQPLQ